MSARNVVHARPPRGTVGTMRHGSAEDELRPFLEDAAHYPGGHAQGVWFPTSEAEVAAVLRHASRVLVIGAQSSLTGGATPFGDVLLSTARLAAIGPWSGTGVVTGPGALLSVLEDELQARGLYYPPAPTYDGATVGGIVATNAAGAATFKYGTTRDWVAALTVVLASGEVLDLRRGEVVADERGGFDVVASDGTRQRVPIPGYRMPEVPKLSAGYYAAPGMDLIDLFIGSEGTLGVVTAIELRLSPRPPGWFVALVPLPDETAALALTDALRTASRATWRSGDPAGIDVAAVEYMDGRCLALLREDGVDVRERVPLPADAGALILLQAEVPAANLDATYETLASFADPRHDSALARLCRLLERHGVLETTVPVLPGDEARRRALFALREAVPMAVNSRIAEAQRTVDAGISKSGGDVIVPFERLGEALARYRDAFECRGLDYAIWGHLSDGNVHPNVIPRTPREMEHARAAQLAVGTIAIELGGAPLSEHGTGRNPVKQTLLRRLYGPDGIASMRAVKRALDPAGLFAPGVIFPEASP